MNMHGSHLSCTSHFSRSQNTPDDIDSRSPVPQRRSLESKSRQQPAPPPSSEPMPTVSTTSLNGGSHKAEKTSDHSGSEKEGVARKEGGVRQKRSSASSTDRHQSRHRVKGHGGSRQHLKEGSTKQKVKPP